MRNGDAAGAQPDEDVERRYAPVDEAGSVSILPAFSA